MKKEFFETSQGFDESYKIASDWDLIVRAMLHSEPVIWEHPLGRFELGGESSKNIYSAHMELKSIRKKYLSRNITLRIFDEIWCAYYLKHLGYSNKLSKFLGYLMSFGLLVRERVFSTLLSKFRMLMKKLESVTIGSQDKHESTFFMFRKRKEIQHKMLNFRLEITYAFVSKLHQCLGILPYAPPRQFDQLNPRKDT